MMYFDNAATTRMYPEVFDAMKPWLTEQYANPSAEYPFGREARKAVEQARKDIADTLDADPEQIVFTSGGTEANNMVMNHMIFMGSEIEHPSVYEGLARACLRPDADGRIVPNAGLAAAYEKVTEEIDIRYAASVMWVNNELGTVNDIPAIAALLKGYFHTDAVQGYGVLDARPIAKAVDYMSVSAHKFHGPKGVGFLYLGKGVVNDMHPLLLGGGQERGLRSGTENVASIVGMAKAAQIADRRIRKGDFKWLKHDYADYIREKLAPVAERFNGDSRKIVSVTLKDVTASSMVLALGEQGICVSAGSACHSNTDVPSRVLKAIGLTDDQARSTIRISLGDDTTEEEVRALVAAIISTREILMSVTE